MPSYLAPLNLNKNELQNAKIQSLASDPTGLGAGDAGLTWYNSTTGLTKQWDGTAVQVLTNVASGATSANTPGAIVARDGSGNFAAGTITAALTGTASNATQLNSQAASFYTNFANSTGTRDHNAISDFDTQVRTSRLDQMAAPTAAVALGSQRITGLSDPSSAQDAATKNYVDQVATGLDIKASVRAATTGTLAANTYANGTSGVGATLTANANGVMAAVDGYTLSVGERVLVKNEATALKNGIYTVTSVGAAGAPWVLTRATDADTGTELTAGSFTFVEGTSTTLGGTGWVLNVSGTITMGTTSLNWSQFSGGAAYTASHGLTIVGNDIQAVGTANRIDASGSAIDISSAYVGQTSITTLGTVATGTWSATTIALNKGGTGATTAAAARTALGTVGAATMVAPATSAGASFTFNHNLNSLNVLSVKLRLTASPYTTYDVDFVPTDANNVSVTVGTAIAATTYTAMVEVIS